MDLCTYHSHCNFCDGKAPAEDFVERFIAADREVRADGC